MSADFNGYSPLAANFAQVPMEVFQDDSLSANDHQTLLVITVLIAYEQFRRGEGRLTPVPLPWRLIAERLRLSEEGSKDRVAALEAIGRLRVLEGPPQRINDRLLSGPNLFVLRWTDEPPTSRLFSRVARRARSIAKLAEARASKAEGVIRITPSDPPRSDTYHPLEETGRITPSNPSRTPDTYPPPSSKITDQEITERNTEDPSVRQYPPEAEPPMDGQTDGPPFSDEILNALNGILDPIQVPKVIAGPFKPLEVWGILESIRVYGQKLNSKAGTAYNALTTLDKGRYWLLRVAPFFEEAGWVELPEDETHLEPQDRRESRARLAAQGLKRLPLDSQGQAAREAILAAAPKPEKPKPPVFPGCEDPKAVELWNALAAKLQETLPERTFEEWIKPCGPRVFAGGNLHVWTPTPSFRIWIEQQLMDELYEAMQDVIKQLEIPEFSVVFQ